jgi:hypothetical protein
MHPIQDLFLERFSYVLQFDMHFYLHSYVDKNYIHVKSGCYNELCREQQKTTKELLNIVTQHVSGGEVVGAAFIVGNVGATANCGRAVTPRPPHFHHQRR